MDGISIRMSIWIGWWAHPIIQDSEDWVFEDWVFKKVHRCDSMQFDNKSASISIRIELNRIASNHIETDAIRCDSMRLDIDELFYRIASNRIDELFFKPSL